MRFQNTNAFFPAFLNAFLKHKPLCVFQNTACVFCVCLHSCVAMCFENMRFKLIIRSCYLHLGFTCAHGTVRHSLARRSEKQGSDAERRGVRPKRNALARRGAGQSSWKLGVEMARRSVACSSCQPWRSAARHSAIQTVSLEQCGAARRFHGIGNP